MTDDEREMNIRQYAPKQTVTKTLLYARIVPLVDLSDVCMYLGLVYIL